MSTPDDWNQAYINGTLRKHKHEVELRVTDREITVVIAMFVVSVLLAACALYWMLA